MPRFRLVNRDENSLSDYWRRRIVHLALRVNFAWWLESFLLVFFSFCLLCMCALLLGRRLGWNEVEIWRGFLLGLIPLGVGAWFWARGRFESRAAARVRLEYALKLNTRLSAAEAGVGRWPDRRGEENDFLEWRWGPVLILLGASLALLAAGAWIPVKTAQNRGSYGQAKPPVLENLELSVEMLEKSRLVQEDALDKLKEQVDELAEKPADEMFSHANLEAAGHLKESLRNQLKMLEQDLRSAEGTLAKMQQDGPALSESQMAQLSEQLALALQGAQGGPLPLNGKFLENLPAIDPSKLQSLTPEQARKMLEKLKEAKNASREARGAGEDPMALLLVGQPQGQAGPGTPTRGPGSVPLTLSADQTRLDTEKVEGMSNEDMSRAGLGDLVGVSKGEHEDKPPEYAGPVSGGGAAQGAGGEAVWVNQLTPEEQAQVKAFFK